MSGCQCNKAAKQSATELLLPMNLSRPASQITNRVVIDTKRRVRSGVDQQIPPIAQPLSAFDALGIQTGCKSFPDYGCLKQVQACFNILPGANDDAACVRCPSPPIEPCSFPLPSPSPCCQPKKECCQCPPLPPQCNHKCEHKCVPCDKFAKIKFIDPCDEKTCRWTIMPDECGHDLLIIQCDGHDVATIDCNGNLKLLGGQEATKYCLAPLEDSVEKQWCFKTNPGNNALQFDCEDRNHVLEGDEITTKTILFTKSGSIIESTTDATFDANINCFLFNTDSLPATIIVHNPSDLLDKSVKLSDGAFNGQTVTIVNVDATPITVNLNGILKTLNGDSIMIVVWSSVSGKWISK